MTNNNAPPTQPTVEEVVRQLDSQAKFLHQASSEIGCAGHYGWGNTCSQAADAIEDAIALLSALEKDAARYRWLRDGNNPAAESAVARCADEELDMEIDAALEHATAIDLARGADNE